MITRKKGYLLENGHNIENNEILCSKERKKVNDEAIAVINRRINWILSTPEDRKKLNREFKLNRILSE